MWITNTFARNSIDRIFIAVCVLDALLGTLLGKTMETYYGKGMLPVSAVVTILAFAALLGAVNFVTIYKKLSKFGEAKQFPI